MGNLLNLAVYNPALLTDQDFLASFVARENVVAHLLKRLGEIAPTNLAQHTLLLGQRGMGKTSLMRRLALAVKDDPTLSDVLLPLTFREEQYNVHNMHIFWCNCLDALGDWFEKTGETEKANTIDDDVAMLSRGKKDPDGAAALDVFKTWMKREKRRPILFLDNIDIILEGLKKQQWDLRRVLQESGGIVVVGASTHYMEAAADRDAAFYDFFQVTVLEKLSHGELMACLRRLAEARGEDGRIVIATIDEDPGRIRTLYDLTGGNPRTLILLYLLLEMDGDGDVFRDLEQLLDQVTALYKARVEDLAPQARVVLDALALAWNPVAAADIAGASRLETSTASTQLDRMVKEGLVEKTTLSSTTKTAFQLSERFFNIWYLMRHAPRRQRTRLRWLTIFLRTFYTPKQLTDRATDFLRFNETRGLDRREYSLALSDAFDDPGWRNLLGFEALTEHERHAVDSVCEAEADNLSSEIPTPKTANDWLVHGQLLSRHLDRCEDAESAYRTAIELDSKWAVPLVRLGALLQDRLERHKDAENAYREAIELDPSLPEAWAGLGHVLHYHLECHDEAEYVYRRAIELDPMRAALWGWLGDLLHHRLGRYEAAEAAYRSAIEIDPMWTDPWRVLGYLLHERLQRYDEAEDAYRKAIALDPRRPAPWLMLGDLLKCQLDRYEESKAAYQKAIELHGTVRAWFSLGDLLLNQFGQIEEATEAYKHAIKFEPMNGDEWGMLGYLQLFLFDRRTETAHAFNQALRTDPKNLDYRSNLLALHLLDSESENSKDDEFDAVVAELPVSEAALFLAIRAIARENFGEGSRQFQIALDADDATFFDSCRNFLVLFLRLAVSRGYGDKLLRFFEDEGINARYWPVYAALDAYVHGEERLQDVNPEVRGVATQIYNWLDIARKAQSEPLN